MFFITIVLLYIKIPNPGSRTQDLFSLRGGTILLLQFDVCVFMQSTAKDRPSLIFLELKKLPKSLTHTDNNKMLSIVLYLLCEILLNIIHTLNTVNNYLGRERE